MGHLTETHQPAAADANQFERYAVYFAPREGTALAKLGSRWLGVNAETGYEEPDPNPYVASPRRYGFHATLKAPIRLADGISQDQFLSSVAELASNLSSVELGNLSPEILGNFLALVPRQEKHTSVATLAWKCVHVLDRFRAPLTPEEIARRTDLNEAEKQNLLKWGYPYVSDQFRFHMTLTSSLSAQDLTEARHAFLKVAHDVLDEPVCIDALSVFGDPGSPETFRLVERFDLTG